jgi:O-antigen ligase
VGPGCSLTRKMHPARARLGCRLAAALFVGAPFLVPLATAPWLVDPYVSIKWHLLALLAAGWLLVERFACGSRGLPGVVTALWPAWAALAASVVIGSLRNGVGWAVEPLTARATFVALALASFWYFRRTGLRLPTMRAGALASVSVVVAIGLLQFAGLDLLSWLPGGDHRSATFGNVNLAAQFVGLALVVLLAVSPAGARSRHLTAAGIATEAAAAASLAYLGLAGTRSVGLALAAAALVLLVVRRLTVARLLRCGAAAALLAVVVIPNAPRFAGPPASSAPESKRASASWRLAVWSDTLALVRDHPEGVGAGNFEHGFIPYALAGRSKPGELVFFRSPHDDYLRLVAEEGVAAALLLLALLAALARELHRSPAVARWRSVPGALLASCGVFLVVEALFQFPFELAFPSLLTAVLLGLALACTEAPAEAESASPARPPRDGLRRLGDAATVLLALAIVAGVVRTAGAERLVAVSRGADVVALERACHLDPRRLEACVQAAWLRSRAGDHATARAELAALLGRSPWYFPAIKLLGEDLLAAGDRAAGCRHLRRYDAMFGGHSTGHERVLAFCGPGYGT